MIHNVPWASSTIACTLLEVPNGCAGAVDGSICVSLYDAVWSGLNLL